MKQAVSVGLFALGLCVVGWFAWSSRESSSDATKSAPSASSAAASETSLTDANGVSSQEASENAQAYAHGSGTQSPRVSSQIASRNGRMIAGAGPQALTPQNEQRLDGFATEMAKNDGRFRDYYTLAQSEEADPKWSDAIERQLQQSVAIHGGKFTGIQTRVPHCSRTVCMLVATGGMGTDVANADWQRLMGLIMGEPWFRANFIDVQSSMQGDAKGVMYITFLIRKI